MKWDKSFVAGIFAGLLTALIAVSVAFAITFFTLDQERALRGGGGTIPSPSFVKKDQEVKTPSGPILLRGSVNAPVVIFEFLDFHCPFTFPCFERGERM